MRDAISSWVSNKGCWEKNGEGVHLQHNFANIFAVNNDWGYTITEIKSKCLLTYVLQFIASIFYLRVDGRSANGISFSN